VEIVAEEGQGLSESTWRKLLKRTVTLPGGVAAGYASSSNAPNSEVELPGKPLAVSMPLASSVDSLANCGALYFFFRPNSEFRVDPARIAWMIFSHDLCSVPNNNPCGPSANLDYAVVLISEHCQRLSTDGI